MPATGPPFTIGLPQEQEDFIRRNAGTLEVWPRLQDTMQPGIHSGFRPQPCRAKGHLRTGSSR